MIPLNHAIKINGNLIIIITNIEAAYYYLMNETQEEVELEEEVNIRLSFFKLRRQQQTTSVKVLQIFMNEMKLY